MTIRLLPILALAFLAGASPAWAGWNNQVSGSSENLKSVDFPTTSIGYAAGQNGTILKTIDGGSNWGSQNSGTAELLWNLDFLDASTGYVVGQNGTLRTTTDGGTNWNPLNPGTGVNLIDVYFANASTGWIVGVGGVIRKTIDSGSNWNPQTSGTTNDLRAVAFADTSTGWTVGMAGTIRKTVDGGANWTPQTAPDSSQDLRGVFVLSPTTAFIVGSNGTILKTTDGGTNWIAQTSGTIASLWHCHFVNASTGYATGSNPTVILKTVDGGATWISQDPATTERLRAVSFTDALTGWAAGDAGTILNTIDGGAGSEIYAISGRVFEDGDFAGTAADWDGGAADTGLDSVDVELFDGTDTYVTSVTTASGGTYNFTGLGNDTYKIRVRSATVGDTDTPPAGGLNATVPGTWPYPLPEMTWGNRAALYGGQDPTVDDTGTGDNAGPGDTYVSVTVTGADVDSVNFGFAYNLIVNTGDDGTADNVRSGQGSLRQFLKNANAIGTAGGTTANSSEFRMQVAANQSDDGDTWWRVTAAAQIPSIFEDGTTLDGSTQRTNGGTDTNSRGPEIEIYGNGAAGSGLDIKGTVTIREVVVNAFLNNGILLDSNSSGSSIRGCYVGTDAVGAADLGNGGRGIYVLGAASCAIGGTNPGDDNVISGNGNSGIRIEGAGANFNTIEGNIVGLNAAGSAIIPNGSEGVEINTGSNNTIGGSSVAARNIITGNGARGVDVTIGSDNRIQGNYIGLNAAGDTILGSSAPGIKIWQGATGTLVGGSGVDEGNIIAGNNPGIIVADVATLATTIIGNSIYSNTGLGIDLGDDGITSNDGGDGDGGPNGFLNFPEITSAAESSGTVTVDFDLDLGASLAGDYRIEFFKNPSGVDTTNGEGETFASAVTINHGGSGVESFSHSFTGAVGDTLTATTTDSVLAGGYGSTSEFSAWAPVTAPPSYEITGRVFEDADFAGTAADWDGGIADAGLDSVDVELFDGTDTYVTSVTTASGGTYNFTGLGNDTYKIRVRSATIGDTDTPPAGGLNGTVPGTWPYPLPEMTWGNRNPLYGGQDPTVDDTGTGDNAGPGDTYVSVTVTGADVDSVNFGFAYNLIVNTGDDGNANNARSGQGSLRQFLKNANGIGSRLSSRFRIPISDPGYTASPLAYTIPAAGALPAITRPVNLDGTSQPGFAGSPIIELDGFGAGAGVSGVTLADGSDGSALRGLIINRFTMNGVEIQAGADGDTVAGNWIGVDADGLTDKGNLNNGIDVRGAYAVIGGTNISDRNVITNNDEEGINVIGASSVGVTIQGNFIGLDPNGTSGGGNRDVGIALMPGASDATIGGPSANAGNVISMHIEGIEINTSNNTIQGNYIGTDSSGVLDRGQRSTDDGIEIQNGGSGNLIGGTSQGAGNIIAFSALRGITIKGGTGNSVLGNRIHSNDLLGIDLNNGVTPNDPGDALPGPNDLRNFPVITSATDSSGTVTVDFDLDLGASLAGDYRIEFFKNPAGVDATNGEGEMFASAITINHGGSGVESFSHSFTGAVGDTLTATTTDSVLAGGYGSTSEFSAWAPVTPLQTSTISGWVYHDLNTSNARDAGELGIGTVWVKLLSAGTVIQAVQADPDSGGYSFSGLFDGTYTVIADTNAVFADTTPDAPTNWFFQNPVTGSLTVVVAGADAPNQNLGLVFDFDLAVDCACGYEDGLFTQATIAIDGAFTDWALPLSDGDNNACDATDDTDLDHPVQSTGRNLLRTAIAYDGSYFSMFTQRVGQSNNTQNFIYYGDTNNDGIMQNGEPVIVALWQGNTGAVDLKLYAYDDLGSGGDPLLDAGGYADGYSMPGDLTHVKDLPALSGIGATTGPAAGTQMEWTILWLELGIPAGSAISWHSSSTNANPGSAGLAAQIDDNLGGCGGQCTGSNQFGGVAPVPVDVRPGEAMALSHEITNTGNGNDYFDFASTWTGAFAPDSIKYYMDLGVVGSFDGPDTLLIDGDGDLDPETPILTAGQMIDILVVVWVPGPPATGTIQVTTTATSNFVPGCGGTATPVSGEIIDELTLSAADLSILKTDGVTTAAPRDTLTYTLTVTNTGPVASVGATVTDTFDPTFFDTTGITWDCAVTSGTGNCAAANGTGNLNTTVDLDSASVATITLRAPLLLTALGPFINTATVTAINEADTVAANNTSADADTVLLPSLVLVKRAFLTDGTPVPQGTTLPKGTRVQYLLYVNNPGNPILDVSLADILDPGLLYIPGTLKIDNSVASCSGPLCTGPEEAAIYAAVNAVPAGTDALDGDPVSYSSGATAVFVGNQTVPNLQLDLAADKVLAVLFEVKFE